MRTGTSLVCIVLCLTLSERAAIGEPPRVDAPCNLAAIEPRHFERSVALVETFGAAFAAVLVQGRWWLSPGSYHLQAHGVRVGEFIVTASHALHPLLVEASGSVGGASLGPLARINTATIRITADGEGAAARVAYDNPTLDLAILRTDDPPRSGRGAERVRTLPAVLKFARGGTAPRVGDCLTMLTTRVRDEVRQLEITVGHVAFEHMYSSDIGTVAALQVNTFTTTLHVLHGDSGAPVLLLRQGMKPVVIGVVSATRWPHEPFGYVNAIDRILPVLDALTNGPLPQQQQQKK